MLTRSTLRELHGTLVAEIVEQLAREIGLDWGEDVDRRVDDLLAERGKPDLNLYPEDDRCVALVWDTEAEGRVVYARQRLRHLDLWRKTGAEVRKALDTPAPGEIPVRQLTEEDAAPEPEPFHPEPQPEPEPVRPVTGPGPYDAVTLEVSLEDTPMRGIPIPGMDSDAFQEVIDRGNAERDPVVRETQRALSAEPVHVSEQIPEALAAMREVCEIRRRERRELARGAVGEPFAARHRGDTDPCCELCLDPIKRGELIRKCSPREGCESTSRRMHQACVERWAEEVAA